MVDFSERVAEYWKAYKNSNINHALINFEFIEQEIYQVDANDQSKMIELLSFIEEQEKIVIDQEVLLRLMSALPAAYMFYLLHQLNRKDAEYVAGLIDKANDHKDKEDIYKNFYDRNMLFEKLQIVSRIFSSDRVNKLISVLSE
ncbi:type IVB secretion system protein IcmW [Piscirickettsia litoralis]|uniref:Uncharacterized protein n=1 Tax=Piscirickettsia litoralis TaxID=1891921 RepID=A0ABX3A5M9_9GAMM|nr:type IVB secretion system protein IcmW [Piscirickettsia litoralis]ODN43845.1 hypothetical protein BGC07_14300 [Piscirickettsia litoralis]